MRAERSAHSSQTWRGTIPSRISQPKTVLGLVFPVLTWLIGLGAVVFLWRRESTEFFKPQRLV